MKIESNIRELTLTEKKAIKGAKSQSDSIQKDKTKTRQKFYYVVMPLCKIILKCCNNFVKTRN